MGNNLHVQYTKFQDLNECGDIIETMFGYRIYDDYGQRYNNGYYNLDELSEVVNENNVIEYIKEEYNNSADNNDFYHTVEQKGGLYFNGKWIELNNSKDGDEQPCQKET